jgi:hypothetical protein
MKKLLLAGLFCLFSFQVQAQDTDRYPQQSIKPWSIKVKKQRVHYRTFIVRNRNATVIGSRPAGCPHRFCGCALAIKVFGRIVPHLNLAANWLKFPRANPAPGMVAARRGHVFKLLAHVNGNVWQVWDANSGGGRIRIHHRSIAGYAIVNPSSG